MRVDFKQFPASVAKIAETNRGLKQALSRLANGSRPTPRSWFYENKTPEWILEQVTQQLKGMKDLKLISDWDLSKSDKFGPQGGSAPLSQRLESLDEYFQHLSKPQIVDDPLWRKAKKLAIATLKFNHSGIPTTSKAVTQRGLSEDKYNTGSGYPLYIRRKRIEAIEEAINNSSKCITEKFPCTLGTRASMGKVGKEARNIFMASMAVNVNGQRYQQPLQDYIRSLNLDFFTPWEGWQYVQERISDTIRTYKDSLLWVGADYIHMDEHLNIYHGLEVYDVVKHYFQPKFWPELEEIIRYVFEMPILTNLGYINQSHAMPSGSEWTNFLETVWNFIFKIYLALKYHFKLVLTMGIGDDQIYALLGMHNNENTIKWMTDVIIREFEYAGLPGNPAKQEISFTNFTFLQRKIDVNYNGLDGDCPGAGVYPLTRNVTSQVFPEFYHNDKLWDKSMFALRVIMIAENCNQHPLFHWYIKFIAESNPNVLEWVRSSDRVLHETQERAKKIARFLPTYNQEKQDQSILTFKTIKLLREIR